MREIPAGEFMMGSPDGQWDEMPVHKVKITEPFYMSVTEITNAQYELFDPAHKVFRGKNGFSADDNEAVVFVSWNEANAFCRWLSEKENRSYRLPTEAQWEYACRAGTSSNFSTGGTLPQEYNKRQENCDNYEPVEIFVGVTRANPWGLYDMHGNVEEWCNDWYGAYSEEMQTDPTGAACGVARVTRGGSHSTDVTYLRSSNRMGTLPDDKNQLIGFRVVVGNLPSTKAVDEAKPLCMSNVSQARYDWPKPSDSPYFAEPLQYLHETTGESKGPVFGHNHCPSITWCDNGDMLVIWFSTPYEKSRDMLILGSRLRQGRDEWDAPSVFFHVPDRNVTGSALLNDGKGTLYHFNGLDTAYHWRNLALVMRSSTDDGATWSVPRIIDAEHGLRNQVISGTIITSKGVIVQACDGGSGGSDGSVVHLGMDNGKTWINPPALKEQPVYEAGKSGHKIAGIHAGVVELKDGSLMAFGRDNNIGGNMPKSISKDMGKSWTYSDSGFPRISGGQRLVLMRLREGAIMLVSFTDIKTKEGWQCKNGMTVKDAAGNERKVYGMYAALSFDDGKTWPVRKLVTNGDPAKEYYGGGWTKTFTMDQTHSEPGGYLSAVQSPDGVIHLVSSGLYYRFNFEWLKMPMAAIR